MRQIFKPLLLACSLLFLTACSDSSDTSANNASADAVVVGMSGTYFPFTFSKDDELQGFEVDLWNAIGEEMGQPVAFITTNFSGLFGMLQAGKIDTIANQITMTPERLKQYYFATPYVYDGAQTVVRNDNTDIQSTADLCGKKVAVNFGSNFADILNKMDTDNCIDIVTYDVGIEQDVVLGRSDAFVMDRTSAVALIQESGLPLKLAGTPFEVLKNGFPFKKDEQGAEMRDRVNTAIKTLRDNGTLAALSQKWFHADITQPIE